MGIVYGFDNNMNGSSLSLQLTKKDKSMKDIKLKKSSKWPIDRTFISLTGRDRVQCDEIFDCLEQCQMTQILNIPSSINQEIALFGIGVFQHCKMCKVSLILTLNELDGRSTIICKACLKSRQCQECSKVFKKSLSLQRHILMKRCRGV